ncbi:putative U4/U6 small nuclear ribonucleoprotein Prp3 [Medicago truncatula]|nr:putative U4/U6 small nuclear ribonucleoprotein Prp3 [Medicago truncatula]
MEYSVETRYSLHKRKDREHSEDRELDDKIIRVSEAKKERRRFGDKLGSLSSSDALAKAKKALQIQKLLSEKLKKIPQLNKRTKAPFLRLDAQGREIDEHGNVVNVTKPSNLSTLKVNINKQKKDAFEILKPVLDVNPESNPHFDERMGIDKTKLLRPKRMNFLFVEEGKWSRDAESIKWKSKFGEAQAKEQKDKQAQLAKAKAAPDINPNLIEITERVAMKAKLKDPIPDIGWWDVELLHSGNYGDIANGTI